MIPLHPFGYIESMEILASPPARRPRLIAEVPPAELLPFVVERVGLNDGEEKQRSNGEDEANQDAGEEGGHLCVLHVGKDDNRGGPSGSSGHIVEDACPNNGHDGTEHETEYPTHPLRPPPNKIGNDAAGADDIGDGGYEDKEDLPGLHLGGLGWQGGPALRRDAICRPIVAQRGNDEPTIFQPLKDDGGGELLIGFDRPHTVRAMRIEELQSENVGRIKRVAGLGEIRFSPPLRCGWLDGHDARASSGAVSGR